MATRKPDLVILDLGLPDMNGQDTIKQLREWTDLPILVLSARTQETEKVAALDAGADDYLTKPFGVAECLARVRVLLRRRTHGSAAAQQLFQFGDIKVDLVNRQVAKAETAVHLTPIEYRLLSTLIRNAGKVITHRELLLAVWGIVVLGAQPVSARLYGPPAAEAGRQSGDAAPHPHRDRSRLSAGGGLSASPLRACLRSRMQGRDKAKMAEKAECTFST